MEESVVGFLVSVVLGLVFVAVQVGVYSVGDSHGQHRACREMCLYNGADYTYDEACVPVCVCKEVER